MDEQLDNELKKRIQEVFENYEDTTADEGWLLLREKFPEKEEKRRGLIWIWWGSTAAVLFIFLGIGLWYFGNNDGNSIIKKYAHQPVKLNNTQTTTSTKTKNDSVNYLQQTAKQDQLQAATIQKTKSNGAAQSDQSLRQDQTQLAGAQKAKIDLIKSTHQPSKQDQLQIAGVQKTTNKHSQSITGNEAGTTESILAANTIKASKQSKANSHKNHGQQNNWKSGVNSKPTEETLAANEETDDTDNPVNKMPAQQFAAVTKVDTASINKAIAKPNPVKKTIEDMFAADKQTPPQKKKDDKKSNDKRVHFGVYAATYFSYAKGSDNEVNAGAGFSSDIKISNNLKFVTGVSIAQNTLSYSSSSSNIDAPLVAAAAAPNPGGYINLVAIPSVKNYNASLVGLDIPMNLKYELNPQKSDTYILAGLSSGTFINQSYTYFYNYPAVNSASLQQTQGATTTKSFDGFYFAKTLNVAFGVGYPLGKNHLIIEPFLKYPLEGLGAQQIRFGAGGINLKFNFTTKK